MTVDGTDTWWGPSQSDQRFVETAILGTIVVAPEPNTALLMGLGLAGLASRRR